MWRWPCSLGCSRSSWVVLISMDLYVEEGGVGRYWNRGGGQQTTSSGVRSMRSPMLLPLLRILLWLRHAALGLLVVPDVNCMFAISLGSRPWSSKALSCAPSSTTCSYRRVLLYSETSMRPAELSTRTIFCNDGTSSDSSFEPVRFGTRCVRSDILERGSFRGRFVSAPMMRWDAARWFSAERTCGALKAGFNGTSIAPSLNSAYVAYSTRQLHPYHLPIHINIP